MSAAQLLLDIGCAMICAPAAINMCLRILRRTRRVDSSLLVNTLGCVVMLIGNVLLRDWPWVAVFAALVIVSFRRSRRRRKRTPAALGAKARARIAAMTRTMRERATSRHVLRPQRTPA